MMPKGNFKHLAHRTFYVFQFGQFLTVDFIYEILRCETFILIPTVIKTPKIIA